MGKWKRPGVMKLFLCYAPWLSRASLLVFSILNPLKGGQMPWLMALWPQYSSFTKMTGGILCLRYKWVSFFFFFFFLRLHPRHTEVSGLGVESELQLPAYTTATATLDLSCIYKPNHSSRQCWILHPLSEAWDRTCTLMDASRIALPLRHKRNSVILHSTPAIYYIVSCLYLFIVYF